MMAFSHILRAYLTPDTSLKPRPDATPLCRSALDFPFSACRVAPSKTIVARRGPYCDDVMAHQVASHAIRLEYLQYRRRAVALRLRIAPCIGVPDPARLGRIQALYALEQQLAVFRRQARTEVSLEWDDLTLRCCRQTTAGRECNGQPV